MYQPDKKSKLYLYIVFFSAVFLAVGAFINFRALEVQNGCSEMALKTSGLTKDFKFDPYSSYDYTKAQCESGVLSATSK
jgi:hypothetical protein